MSQQGLKVPEAESHKPVNGVDMEGVVETPLPLRSESDVVMMNSEIVTFGGEKFEIQPLPYKKGIVWRKELDNLIKEVGDNTAEADVTTLIKMVNAIVKGHQDGKNKFDEKELMENIRSKDSKSADEVRDFNLNQFPEKMLYLIKSYTPYLDWDSIEDKIYDFEIAKAFRVVCRMALPFGDSLRLALTVDQSGNMELRRQNPLPSDQPLN